MTLRHTEKLNGFIAYTDERGLTDKAKRVKNLWSFVTKINDAVENELGRLDVVLNTDPGTIVSSKYFSQLGYIIRQTIALWDEVNFPVKESLFVRTDKFSGTGMNMPLKVLAFADHQDDLVPAVTDFLHESKAEQAIIHPRVTDLTAKRELIVFRPTTIPGDIHCELAFGGVIHLRDMETKEVYQSFNLNEIRLDEIYPKFIPFVKAFRIIAGYADEYVKALSPQVTERKTPVYEIKCFSIGGKNYMNLFDYEIV